MSQDDSSKLTAERMLERRPAFLVGAIANKFVLNGSTLLRREGGIGFTEWRVMVMLALEPGVTAKRISEVVGVDKAAISRSIKILAAAGLIEPTPDTAGRRSQDYRLSPAGQEFHDRLQSKMAGLERCLVARLGAEELDVLVDLLQRLLAQSPTMAAVVAA